MHARPSIFFDFLNDYGYFDPRLAQTRASTGTYCDRNGILRTRAVGNPRFNFQPSTGYPLGLLIEYGEVNLLLWSEDFTNVAWAKSASTITANAAVAPDGNTTADTLTATGANGWVGQLPGTFAASSTLGFSVFAQRAASQFLKLVMLDASGNNVSQWFDLTAGTLGIHSPGSGTLLYSIGVIEPWPNGWYRCTLFCNTTTITVLSAMYASASAVDGVSGGSGDSVNLWGAMSMARGALGSFPKMTSYIATTTAAVMRNGDVTQTGALDPSLYDPYQGTLLFDFVLYGGMNTWLGGFVGASTEIIGILAIARADGINGVTAWAQMLSAAGGTQGFVQDVNTGVVGINSPVRIAYAYKRDDFAVICCNGRTPIQSASVVTAANFPVNTSAHFVLSGAPNNPIGGSCNIRRAAYFPRKLTNAQLQKLTT